MPTLENINGASLAGLPGAYSRGLSAGAQSAAQGRAAYNAAYQQAQQRKAQEERRGVVGDQLSAALGGNVEGILKISQVDPNLANALIDIRANDNKVAAEKLARFAEEQGAFAASISGMDDMNQRQALMVKSKEFLDSGDIKLAEEMVRLSNLPQEQRNAEINQDIALSGLTKDQLSVFGYGEKPSFGQVQSSEILPDGTTIQVTKDGKTRVTSPEGAVLSGKDRVDAIRDAQKFGVDIQKMRSEARAEGGLSVQLDLRPKIEAAIATAKNDAKERGEKLSDLGRAKAALPALEEVVAQLKALAPVATNTYTGRAFDAVSRELGFGSGKGATARAKFVAIVDNQILPLLKQTFGAAFTVTEAESLKATMGDPNASPDEKMAQLDAFMAQKYRDIEQKEAGIGGNTGNEQSVNWSDL